MKKPNKLFVVYDKLIKKIFGQIQKKINSNFYEIVLPFF